MEMLEVIPMRTVPLTLNPATNPFLQGHVMQRGGREEALLPGVAFLHEAAVHAAADCNPSLQLAEIRDVEFRRALFVPVGSTTEATLVLEDEVVSKSRVKYRASLKSPGKKAGDPPVLHATASLLFAKESPPVEPFPCKRGLLNSAHALDSRFYESPYYHYSGIMALIGVLTVYPDGAALASLNPKALESPEARQIVIAPAIAPFLDLGFQTCELLEMWTRYEKPDDPLPGLDVPVSVGLITYCNTPFGEGDQESLRLFARRRGRGLLDFTVFHRSTGRVFAEVRGFRTGTLRWEGETTPTKRDFFGLT